MQYLVHYIIKGYSVREPFFIYSGFKEVITFVLPSGMTLFNRTSMYFICYIDDSRRILSTDIVISLSFSPNSVHSHWLL